MENYSTRNNVLYQVINSLLNNNIILSIRIALRFHLGAFNDNILISLMSLISIISISVGIAISIIALSVIHGFQYELNKRILTVIPHGEIRPVNKSFINWKATLTHIRKLPHVISATPYINFSGIIQFHNKWHLVYVRSIDLENNMQENELLHFLGKEHWGNFCANKKQILLGKGISDILAIKVGDWITMMIPCCNDCSEKNKILSSNKIRLQVSGIFNLNSQLDRNLAIISLSNAQHYNKKNLNIEGISIRVNNIFNIDKIIFNIKKILIEEHVYISSWMDTYGYIYRDIQIVRIIIYLSTIFVMGIFCFNVIATLILFIKDKNYDVIILRVLGAKNILIQYIFFWYGLIIYIISSFIGGGLGIIGALNLTKLITVCKNFWKKDIFLEEVYFIDFLPSKLNFWDMFLILGLILLFGILVSWYFSLKVKDINFSQILK